MCMILLQLVLVAIAAAARIEVTLKGHFTSVLTSDRPVLVLKRQVDLLTH